MGLQSTLVPTRFLMLLSHFMAVVMVFHTKSENILVALPSDYSTTQFDKRNEQMLAALWMSFACFALEFLGLIAGFSLFFDALNTAYIILHFCGTVLVCWFILETWHYYTFWYMASFFSIVPASLEVLAMLRPLCCKTPY